MPRTAVSGPRDEVALLGPILAGRTDFALVHRPRTGPAGRIEVLLGDTVEVGTLAEIPLREDGRPVDGAHEVLVVVPYRQLAERGFAAVDDRAPVLALRIAAQASVPVRELLARLPDVPTELSGGAFDLDDAAYADIVRRVVSEEIGTGEGANFVIRRSFVAQLPGYSPLSALAVFRRLMESERGAYWTFVVHAGGRTFVGATPERHVSLDAGVVVMNPISGTYRYPPEGPSAAGVLAFLADTKEAGELSMVVDEELKTVARISEFGVRVSGPRLLEMAGLAHTEYTVEGRTGADVRDVLRETLFAPTVTGSPVQSAAEVVRRFEPHGRGYYSGVLALVGRDAAGGRTLDSSILIRTAEIDATGRVTIGVGATLVRDSDPASEAAETRAKAAGLLAAFGHGSLPRQAAAAVPAAGSTQGSTQGSAPGSTLGSAPWSAPSVSEAGGLARHPGILAALRRRNAVLSSFWLEAAAPRDRLAPALVGQRVLVVDAEDSFTALWAHQLRALGATVTVRRFDRVDGTEEHDLVLLGPGPGDPRRTRHPKIARLGALTRALLEQGRPFLSVCLSHQVLSGLLGLDLVRLDRPDQGVQRRIDLFGRSELVGFYNTFAARATADLIVAPGVPDAVEVCRDQASGQVHALRGPAFRSVQFHPESVLSQNGAGIVADLLVSLLEAPTPLPDTLGARLG